MKIPNPKSQIPNAIVPNPKSQIPNYIIAILVLFSIESRAQQNLSPPDSTAPTTVYISMIINNISDISSASQLVKADIFFSARWKDSRLVHNEKRTRVVSIAEIWEPRITIINRLNINKSFPEEATISNDGTVIYMQRIYGEFMQEFHLKDFPFDTQEFLVRFVAIGPSSNEIRFETDTKFQSGISDKFKMYDWEIQDWKYDASEFVLMQGHSPLPSYTFKFTAERDSDYYILIFIVPLLLIIMMSWTVFWLDASLSGPQIAVATTSMLTLIAYRFVVIGNLPKISYMTRMDIFILGSSILIFLTLVQAVITSGVVHKGNAVFANSIDRHSRWIFPVMYSIVCLIAFLF